MGTFNKAMSRGRERYGGEKAGGAGRLSLMRFKEEEKEWEGGAKQRVVALLTSACPALPRVLLYLSLLLLLASLLLL